MNIADWWVPGGTTDTGNQNDFGGRDYLGWLRANPGSSSTQARQQFLDWGAGAGASHIWEGNRQGQGRLYDWVSNTGFDQTARTWLGNRDYFDAEDLTAYNALPDASSNDLRLWLDENQNLLEHGRTGDLYQGIYNTAFDQWYESGRGRTAVPESEWMTDVLADANSNASEGSVAWQYSRDQGDFLDSDTHWRTTWGAVPTDNRNAESGYTGDIRNRYVMYDEFGDGTSWTEGAIEDNRSQNQDARGIDWDWYRNNWGGVASAQLGIDNISTIEDLERVEAYQAGWGQDTRQDITGSGSGNNDSLQPGHINVGQGDGDGSGGGSGSGAGSGGGDSTVSDDVSSGSSDVQSLTDLIATLTQQAIDRQADHASDIESLRSDLTSDFQTQLDDAASGYEDQISSLGSQITGLRNDWQADVQRMEASQASQIASLQAGWRNQQRTRTRDAGGVRLGASRQLRSSPGSVQNLNRQAFISNTINI